MVMSLVIIYNNQFNKNLFFFGYGLVFSIVLGLVFLIITPLNYEIISYGMSWNEYFYDNMVYPVFSIQSIKMLIRIVLFIIISISTSLLLDESEFEKIVNRFIKFGMFVICFTFVEFFVKNFLKSSIINNFLASFFGVGGSTLTILLERDSFYSLQGFMKEPSHLAISLFWLGLIVIFSNKSQKMTNFLLILIYLCLFLSRSFAGILYAVGLILIYSVVNKKLMQFLLAVLGVPPLIIMSDFFTYYLERFDKILILKNLADASVTSSSQIRLVSIIENIIILMKRPFFGAGLGVTYAHGAIPSLLSNIGIIGFLFWMLFVFRGIGELRLNRIFFIILSIFLTCWFFTGDIGAVYILTLLMFALMLKFDYRGINKENKL
jgi:hypothetical protein